MKPDCFELPVNWSRGGYDLEMSGALSGGLRLPLREPVTLTSLPVVDKHRGTGWASVAEGKAPGPELRTASGPNARRAYWQSAPQSGPSPAERNALPVVKFAKSRSTMRALSNN